jgi:hypothetical protein
VPSCSQEGGERAAAAQPTRAQTIVNSAVQVHVVQVSGRNSSATAIILLRNRHRLSAAAAAGPPFSGLR